MSLTLVRNKHGDNILSAGMVRLAAVWRLHVVKQWRAIVRRMRPSPALAALLVAGCATAPEPATDGIARAGLNQRVYVDGPYVTPLQIVEDSRCPAGVQCISAGRTRLAVRIDLGSRSEYRVLCSDTPLQVADGQLALVEVTPAAGAGTRPGAYRFGMRFAGGI